MYSPRKILPFLSCCLLLSACSTVRDDVDRFFGGDEAPRETIYAAGESAMEMGYPEMAREMSDGSVHIYSLDEPVTEPSTPETPVIRPSYSTERMSSRRAYGVDPNVTVYPFEDDPLAYPVSQPPALVPPSQSYELRSPFDDVMPLPVPVPVDGTVSYERSHEPVSSVDGNNNVSRVYFKHGSARLGGMEKQLVARAANVQSDKIVVDGYSSKKAEVTNPVERQIVNLGVSLDRAFAVSSELIRNGVPVERIETRAFGDARPAVGGAELSAEAASRRVEIYVADGIDSPADVSAAAAPIPPLVRY